MDPVKGLFGLTADYAAQFLGSLDERPVNAQASVDELVEALGGPAPGRRERKTGRSWRS